MYLSIAAASEFPKLTITDVKKDKNQYSECGNTTVPDRDLKKWHIDRIQTALNGIKSELYSDRMLISSRTALVESELTAWRNAILTAVSFRATLILALYSAGLLEGLLLPALTADLFIGSVAFILFAVIKEKIHGYIIRIEISFLSVMNNLTFYENYVNSQTYHIDNVRDEKILFFFAYLEFASAAVRADQIVYYDNAAKSVFFRKIRTDLDSELEATKAAMETAKISYASLKLFREKYPDDLNTLSHMIPQSFLNYLKEKVE
jgi:hypothetical protein